MKLYIIGITLCFLAACKLQPDSNRNYDTYSPDKIYKLGLKLTPGSVFQYEVSNETEIEVELDEKEVNTLSKTNSLISYSITLDSGGNYLVKTI